MIIPDPCHVLIPALIVQSSPFHPRSFFLFTFSPSFFSGDLSLSHHLVDSTIPISMLEGGPIVLIVTALAAIFTVGLGDEEDNGSGISAYSVFNRGYQRIMGSVDAENLLQQHVGGAMGMAGAMAAGGGGDVHDVAGAHPRAAQPRRDGRQGGNANRILDENNDDNDNENDAANANEEQPQQNRSRKSGKKARRRNLEQRRELQRQRQAAMAMGFGGGDQQEMMAMQQILEEQVAANQAEEE